MAQAAFDIANGGRDAKRLQTSTGRAVSVTIIWIVSWKGIASELERHWGGHVHWKTARRHAKRHAWPIQKVEGSCEVRIRADVLERCAVSKLRHWP